MSILDMTGQPCPIPVIKTRKALEDSDSVIVIVDNMVAVQNLEKMANGLMLQFGYKAKEDIFEVSISKTAASSVITTTIPLQNKISGTVYMIKSDKMGDGSEELGKILIKGFIFSLTQLEELPGYVIFVNSGVFLTSFGSNTVKDLSLLEEKGVKIISCGTCINFYKLEGKTAVGSVANMYEITGTLNGGTKIITI